MFDINILVGQAVTRSSLEREVWGLNLGPVKSDTVLLTARHLCDVSSNGAVLPGRNDTEMGPANSLHASAYYSEYNERFDLIWFRFRKPVNKIWKFDVPMTSGLWFKWHVGKYFIHFSRMLRNALVK